MIEWYLKVVRDNYANFNGRARRSEYWYFVLFNLIITIALNVIDYVIGLGFLSLIYGLAVLVPSIAVCVRRLHDIDKTGWLVLIGLTGIGAIVLLVFFAQEGTRGTNQYGPDPKNPHDLSEIGKNPEY